ncbi:MAG: hypothetical protein KDA75_09140 [Planctomycetaceae bacterium]|nr:hypothetical protein [Planctomycetaceae bacterium]
MIYSRLSTLAVALLLTAAHPATAQPIGFRELRAEQVKPAFSVEPVVQRLEARRGQLLPFRFDLTSLARTTTIDIRPVQMTQDLTGAVHPDVDNPPPGELTLTSPSRLVLDEDTQTQIEGTIRVPTTNSPFHTFGILVTDYGRRIDTTSPQPQAAEEPQMSIEFITRYLLRIDIDVQGVRPENAGKLILEAGELREEQGYPQSRIVIVNPTESPLEFQVECRLLSTSDPSLSDTFNLGMPVRCELPPPERHLARILPGARIRMEGFVPQTIFPGPYELEATIVAGRRKWKTARFPVLAEDGAFPAQSALVAQIASGVSAAPAQIELSTLRGGSRFVAVTVNNATAEPADFRLSTVTLDDQLANWFAVRPDNFRLQAGGSRKVLVTLGNNRPTDADQYGALVVESQSPAGTANGTAQLLTVLSVVDPPPPNLQLGDLSWQVDGNLPAIVVPVTNAGTRFVPLQGRMQLTDIDNGSRFEFTGGYGRWLLPGVTDSIRFRIAQKIPSGKYELKILINQGEDQPTLELKTLVELSEGG